MEKFCVFLLLISLKSYALNVECGSDQEFRLNSNQTYNFSIENIPKSKFFLIGKEGESPSLSYNSSSLTWSVDLDYYSLSSYDKQFPYLILTSNTSESLYYIKLCSFETLENSVQINSKLFDPKELFCGDHGKLENDSCTCEESYFGRFCGLKYHSVTSDYSEKFEVEPYSLTFFFIDTSYKITYQDKYKSTQIFYGMDFFPSFFEFEGYQMGETAKGSDKNINSFTFFCASEIRCKFKINSGGSGNSIGIEAIIALSVVFGFMFILVAITVWYRVRMNRKARENVVLDAKQIDRLAPRSKFQGKVDTCSICLSDFEKDEEIRKIERCEHTFHVGCIDEWLTQKAVCPNCNTKLD